MPHIMGQTEEVFEALNALCAAWQTTAPSTAQIMTVQYVPTVHLDISLETVTTSEGLIKLQNETILSVIELLLMIQGTIPCGTMSSMEMENPEDPDKTLPSADRYRVDLGEPEGPRVFQQADDEHGCLSIERG
uniref:Uncharacterized protein n=1 Tax=Moniliophthora roreri TaxID=221103 RepID=A0A0W0FYI2_MONRR